MNKYRWIKILNDEATSPVGKGRYFSLPDLTSRLFEDMSLAALSQSLLKDMVAFEAKQLNIQKRSLEEARNLTDFHNHPDVVEEWERRPEDDQVDEYEGSEWFYGALASFVFSVKCLYGTYRYLKSDYPDFKPRTIVDWGAGLGMHSLICTILWPDAKVVYYNLPGLQTNFAKEIKKAYQAENMIIKSKQDNLPPKADLIIAYEFLEHMKNPVEATRDMMKLNPEFFSISFSFTAPCHGHFTYFDTDDGLVHRSEVTRYVNNEFRKKYSASAHGWNARPVIWRRND